MVLSGFLISIPLFLTADASLPLHLGSLCTKATIALGGSAERTGDLRFLADSEALVHGVEGEVLRKMLRQSFQDFLAKLSLRTKDVSQDATIRQKIEARLVASATSLVKKKVLAATEQIKTIGQEQDAAKRGHQRLSLQRRIVREVLGEISIDQVVWQEVAPFLKDFYATLDSQKQAIFDSVVPALEMRIRNRLLKAGIPQDEIASLTPRLLQQSVPILAETLAVEVAKNVKRNDVDAVRIQTNRIVQSVIRKVNLMEQEWPSLAPQLKAIESGLGPQGQKILNATAPSLVTSLQARAWDRVGNVSKDAMEQVFSGFVNYASEILPDLIRSESLVANRTQDGPKILADRIRRAVLGYLSFERMFGYEKAYAFYGSLPMDQRVSFYSGFSTLSRLAQVEVGWRIPDGDNLEYEQRAYLEKLVPLYDKAVAQHLKAFEASRAPEGFEEIAARVFKENAYTPAGVTLEGPLLEIADRLHGQEREVFIKYARHIEDLIETRVETHSRTKTQQKRVREDLYRMARDILPPIFRKEVEQSAELSQSEKIQSSRLLAQIKREMPLTASEVDFLPLPLKLYRDSLSELQKQFFDYSYSHLSTRHQRSTAAAGKTEKVFIKLIQEKMPSEQVLLTYVDPASFRWQARLYAMDVYNTAFHIDSSLDSEVSSFVDRTVSAVKKELSPLVVTATSHLVSQAATGTMPEPTKSAVAPRADRKKSLAEEVDDALVRDQWEIYKSAEASAEAKANAEQALWLFYQPLVTFHAGKMESRLPDSVEVAELMAAGQFGLKDALNKFDPSRGIKFATFSNPRITGAMIDWLRETMTYTRRMQSQIDIRDDLIDSFVMQNARKPSDEELESLLLEYKKTKAPDLSVESVLGLPSLKQSSIDAPLGHDDNESVKADTMENLNIENPSVQAARNDFFRFVAKGFSRVEQMIILLYYAEGESMANIGQAVGISESRVSQMHTEIIKRLQSRFQGKAEEFGLFFKPRKSDVPKEDED